MKLPSTAPGYQQANAVHRSTDMSHTSSGGNMVKDQNNLSLLIINFPLFLWLLF